MNYFKNTNNEIFAYDDEQVKQGYGKDLEEILSPILDGKVLVGHKNISQVETKADGSYYNYYNADGTADLAKEQEVAIAQTKASIEQAIQQMLDDKARELRYDNMMSARSYAGYTNPFQLEAQALSTWCANCWLKAGELEALGQPLTVEEVLEQMPKYEGV